MSPSLNQSHPSQSFFDKLRALALALFHKLGSPRWFYRISGKWLPWLALLTAVLLIGGSVWGLLYAPQDFRQGNSFRIIYIHVPASMLAMAGYVLMAICGAISLIWRMKLAEVAMKCAAPIGAALTFLALITGSIWGKPTWGTWWVWDARITSVLVLFFLYMGVIALYEAFENKQAAAKACAVLSLVGVVNIPIIYWSVEWWFSLHQPATLKIIGKSTMALSMLYPLLVMMIGFYCFYALVLFLHMRSEILQRERSTQWVRDLITGGNGN
ncbi:MAG TPA: heme ABC transporter permease [Spongiibacteraceae bacterium]|nr:heme ABC transporter permease [Spongiibacteraceae bacterium]